MFGAYITMTSMNVNLMANDTHYQAEPDFRIADHAARVRSVINSTDDLELITKRVSDSTSLLLRGEVVLSDFLDNPPSSGYDRHLLYEDAETGFVVLALVWSKRAATPIHDHDTWGVAGVLSGCLTIHDYQLVDDRKKPGYAELESLGEMTARHGDSTELVPPDGEIHSVTNTGDEIAVSIHTYGKNIDGYNIYDLESGSIRWHTVG